MSKKALFFLPDISGFSEFVHNTEINHSKHIMAELMEKLLDNNLLKLKLAEIEGDALFMYTVDNIPTLDQIFLQVRAMFIAMQAHLKRYEYERVCHCGACSSTDNLSLKFVVHIGDIEFIKIKKSVKPHGSDVIKVHRLLKNQIPVDEYVLFTRSVIAEVQETEAPDFMKLAISGSNTYDFGSIDYVYVPLEALKQEVPYVPPIPVDIPKHKLVFREAVITADSLSLYELISNFKYRTLWNKNIRKIDYEEDRLNRVGTEHQCIVKGGKKLVPMTIKKHVKPKQLVYGERMNEIPFVKTLHIYFLVEAIDDKTSHLTAEVYADFSIFGIVFKYFIQKVFHNTIKSNMEEIKKLFDNGFTTI
ncbi:MAG: DUF2652 domain-containing protein [Bacteroidetes bacterium]|nr:DUF2652 domain-containing protein [Bacteroidota bacterium]